MTTPRRTVSWLLLLPFALWASGATRVLHERIAHGGGHVEELASEAPDVPGMGAATAPERHGHSPAPGHHHGSHRDAACAACTTLAGMAAIGLTIDVAPFRSEPEAESPATDCQVLRAVATALPPPSRGPPAV